MPRNALIQVRRDTAANWTSTNPTLEAGEIGFETDTGKLKVGTGSTAWTSLLYATDASDITGATLASNVTASSLTSVGTLGSLAVSGDVAVDTNTLKVDSSNNRVGVGTSSPTQALDVFGVVRSTGYSEKWLVNTSTSITGTQNIDALTNTSYYYGAATSGNFPLNIRGSASVTLNTVMAVGDQLTITFIAYNGATTNYPNTLRIDGTLQTNGSNVFWQGGTAPTAGFSNSFSAYVYTIIKTASNTYSTFASQTRFI